MTTRHGSKRPFSITKSKAFDNESYDDTKQLEDSLENDEEIFGSPNDTDQTDQMTCSAKLAYALVGLPYSMQLSIIAFYINYFLLDVAKVSPMYNAVILFTSRLIDGLTDPIGGYLFNRCSSRWGKMKPWIFFSSPFVALCYFGVWFLPNLSEVSKFIYYFFAHSLLWTFTTAMRIPHTALTVYMTMDQTQRDQLTKYRTLLEAAGLLLSLAFHFGVMKVFKVPDRDENNCKNETFSFNVTTMSMTTDIVTQSIETEIPSNVSAAYMTSAGVVSFLCVATAAYLFFSVREVVDVIPTSETSFFKGFKMIVRYKPFMILTVATVGSILATQSIQSVLQLYLTHVINKPDIFFYLAGTLIVATIALLFVWAIIMRKIGKKKSFFIGNLCLIPTIIIVLLDDYPVWLLFVAAIMGANTVACGYVMPWAMLPECIDAFMLETGRRPVEIFYTFFFLGAKIVQALYSGLVQLSLGESGFDANLCEQPSAVALTLKLLMGAVPGIVLILSTICLYFYSIDEERAKEIQTRLKEMRESSSATKSLTTNGYDPIEVAVQSTYF